MAEKTEMKETKETKETKEAKAPKEETKEQTPEEQLEQMEKVVEEQEKREDEEVSKKADEAFKKEEGRSKESSEDERNLSPEEARKRRFEREEQEKLDNWVPKTQLGRDVRAGKVKNINEIFEKGLKIMEPEIVDLLIPTLSKDVLFIGQAKGKFGGGKRRAFRQTQKVSKEGTSLTFGVMAIVGDGNGHFGIGYGKAAETLPAKEKAIRKAKLNLMKIPRGCASYDCSCTEHHSIPVVIEGKCSSVNIKLMPAPQGTGLVVGNELKKILKAAGIKDVYSKTSGKTRTTFNTVKACIDALNKLTLFQFD